MNTRPPQAKHTYAEVEQFRRRALLSLFFVVLCLFGLVAWYFKLQVLDHEIYATRSDANRIKLHPVVPGRGMIYDRNGRILADNVPAFRLEVMPDKVGDME
ncbi:MAG TPA: penicillin-binding protein 2, partial [Xylella sp.]